MSLTYERPRTIDEARTALDRLEQATTERVAPLSDLAFNWQPIQGRSWSIAEVLAHVVQTESVYAVELRAAVDRARERSGPRSDRRTLEPGGFSRWFLGLLEPPIRRRYPAPSRAVPTVEIRDKDDLLADLRSVHQRYHRIYDEAQGLDLNRVRFRNPFGPLIRFTLATGLLVTIAHEHRHLLQMERVQQAPGYPG
jgi:hypothetical protein